MHTYAAPAPNITLDSPRLQEAMVGDQQTVECKVQTVSGVGMGSVMVNWTGPTGSSIMNDSRISISPTASRDNFFSRTLSFTYLMEDEGNYTCNVRILVNSTSESIEIGPLTGKILY